MSGTLCLEIISQPQRERKRAKAAPRGGFPTFAAALSRTPLAIPVKREVQGGLARWLIPAARPQSILIE
jgi:hypothetical protein